MTFKIKIEPDARLDIQEAINWYNLKQPGLGKKLYLAIISRIEGLAKNHHFEIRYDNVRCLPIDKFPCMIQFTIDELKSLVVIRAVFHTSLHPEKWIKKES